ncbi:Developmental and secondary metabolism regulator veA [Fusarium oligoseptatum]|uniref:Developmental and secondary metabolism regulator veA n=1 Tax=Fusarium oligoseptatum TaxID=2604345 RepID=A0A428TJF8_9HYPO|nr:Developmental and secondary metabolism regulator veA [Fusarium oligoseptatum]
MATPSAIPLNARRDTVARLHRVTRGNRSLWYQMTVLQQPERARACGSGMKANSDRRPVDPPPVVELRIIEGPTVEEGKDITFDYNANFFLYASLEHARLIAHGRVQTPAANNPPILTGVPASGMAYLDRPTEAGYFIFPDLSVRHEGRYRLTFSLFETTKEEKDFDLEPTDGDLPPGVDFRMEIKTEPFSVFSAKKFPGLMESTQLSKTVADQGCRVRIRRDVRMRKRDGKSGGNNGGNGGYDRREEDYGRRRTVTPAAEDPNSIRARSLSNSSEHRAPYHDASRRPSIADSYPPPPPPPSYEPASSGSRHLSFGDPSAPQYPTPRQYAPSPACS